MNNKPLLIVMKHPPISRENNRDSLDIALACSAFDLPISILFLADGVLQLKKNMSPNTLECKDISGQLKALAMYDIEQLYVLDSDLQRYALNTGDLLLTVNIVDNDQLRQLFANADNIINL